MIEIELPDGSIAEFPDGMSDAEIERVLQQQFAPPQTAAGGKGDRERSWGETGIDVLKSAGTGLVEGAVGLAGLPRDAGQWLGEQATYGIGRLMGQPPEQIAAQQAQAAQAMYASPIAAPKSSQIMGAVEGVTGPLPMPETTAGKYARTTGQMAAGALAGPGGVIRKAAMTVVPGVASEAAGQATEGTWAEPYARIGAAVAGGMAAAGRGASKPLKEMREVAPTQAENYAAKNTAYQQLDQAGIAYNPGSLQRMVRDLEATFAAKGADAALHPQATALLNYIKKVKRRPSFQDIDNIRKNAGAVMRSKAENADKMFASLILEKLDDFERSAPLSSAAGLRTADVKTMADNARELARRDILAKQIDDMEGAMEGYRYGTESGIGNQFGSYLRNKQKRNALTTAERQAFGRAARREGLEGLMTAAGSNLGKVVQIGGSIAAAPATGGASLLYGAAGLAGNLAARKASEVAAKKALANARKTVLAGRKAQEDALKAVARNKNKAAFQGLLGGASAAQSPQAAFFLQDANGNVYSPTGALLGRP